MLSFRPAAPVRSAVRALALMCALGFCTGYSLAHAASHSRVLFISHAVDGGSEKVTVALSAPAASFTARVLAPTADMPCRLFVDLNSTRFGPNVERKQAVNGASVRVVRAALNRPGTVRVVLELSQALSVGEYSVRQNQNPPALEIVVKSSKAPKPPPVAVQPGRSAAQEKPSGPRTYLIAIDAGHGGRDPGAIGHAGLQEKKVSLAIALELKKTLDSRPGLRTLMTRSGDQFVSLQDRARIATEAGADLLISIHGNSHANPKIDGIETYYLNFSSDDEARRVAARENFTTPEQIGDLEMILFDLSQSEKTNISSLLAGYVHNKLTAAITGKYKTMRNLGVKHAPMRVLIDAEMPGILFEAGFISNPAESRRLQNASHQKLLAAAIADGIGDFFTSSKTAAYRSR